MFGFTFLIVIFDSKLFSKLSIAFVEHTHTQTHRRRHMDTNTHKF